MGKSARDVPGWGKPEGWGKPPEGEASPELVAKNVRWALLAAAVAGVSLFACLLSVLAVGPAVAFGIVAMSLGQKARALGKQLGDPVPQAKVAVSVGVLSAVTGPLVAVGSEFVSVL